MRASRILAVVAAVIGLCFAITPVGHANTTQQSSDICLCEYTFPDTGITITSSTYCPGDRTCLCVYSIARIDGTIQITGITAVCIPFIIDPSI